MPATWPDSGPFDAAVWEARMARAAAPPERRVIPEAPQPPRDPRDHAPMTFSMTPQPWQPPQWPQAQLTRNPYSAPLRRASRILRDRLNYMEVPPGPLSPRRKRLLSHQTNRLSRIVEILLIASKRYDEEHRDFPPYTHSLPAA